MSRKEEQELELELHQQTGSSAGKTTTDPCNPSFYRSCGAGGGNDPNDAWSPESSALVGPAHGSAAMTGSGSTLLPATWFQAAELSRSEHRDTNRPAPNSQVVYGNHRSAPVNPLLVCKPGGLSRTARLCLAAASRGGEARGRSPSAGDTRGRDGQ